MMIKKIFLLCISLILVTGCSVSYEIELGVDNSIDEKVYFIEDNSAILKYGSSVDGVVSDMVDYFFSVENNIKPQILLNNTANIKNIGKKNSSISLTKKYSDVNYYKNSLFGTYFFDTFDVEQRGSIITLYANSLDYSKIAEITNNYKYRFNFKTLNIRIKVPFEVSYNNADFVEDNVYVWIFNESNSNKDVKIVYNENDVVNKNNVKENNSIVDKIGSTIINTVTFGQVDGEKIGKGSGGIIIFGVVLVLLVIGVLVFKKFIDKKNEL